MSLHQSQVIKNMNPTTYCGYPLVFIIFFLRTQQIFYSFLLNCFKCFRRTESSNPQPPFTLKTVSFIYFKILPHSKKGFEENEEIEWRGSVRKKLGMAFPNSTLFSETMSSPYKDGKIAKSHTVKVKDSLLGNKCPRATVLPVHL